MIKLARLFTPIKLTPDFVKAKTEEYIRTGSSVWRIDWLKDSLKALSHNKCAYCECPLSKESNYMEVEHFEDKCKYPEKVMAWDNLLPSCKHCNGSKSTHDVIAEPIINPFKDDPRDHLYFRLYRYKPKDEKGRQSIRVLKLNDPEREMVDTRFKIGNELEVLIDDVKAKYDRYKSCPSVGNRNDMTTPLFKMLRECQPDSEYSALCATVMHSNVIYQKLKEDLKADGIWDDEMEMMDAVSRELCMLA